MTLSAADLTYLRETQTEALPVQATFQDVSRVRDARGNWATVHTSRPALVPVRFGGRNLARMAEAADVLQGDNARLATLPTGTGAVIGDRLLVGSQVWDITGLGSGETLETAERVAVALVTP